MAGNQSTLFRFLKRKIPPPGDGENCDGGTSRIRTDGNELNTIHSTQHPPRVSRHEVNFDELPYDPADRRRISDYIGQKLQDEVRLKYLIRGPFKPQPGFKFPETMIAGHPRRCQPQWFTKYEWLEIVSAMSS